MPPLEDIGPQPQHVQLLLAVTNPLGRSVSGICFNITVVPVDNQPPQVPADPWDPPLGGGESVSDSSWLFPVSGGQQGAGGG